MKQVNPTVQHHKKCPKLFGAKCNCKTYEYVKSMLDECLFYFDYSGRNKALILERLSGKSLRDVAKENGLSSERVRQIMARFRRQLINRIDKILLLSLI